MNENKEANSPVKFQVIIASLLMVAAFFIPWVLWDNIKVSGADMPKGNFFRISEENFHFANPVPQFNYAVYLLWLVPALAVITILLAFAKKKMAAPALSAAVLGLCAATGYYLFTGVLSDLGIEHEWKLGFFLTIIAAVTLILTSTAGWITKIISLIAGPVVVWAGFNIISASLENEKFEDTSNIKAEFTVTAMDMIKEFQENDSLANAKYNEKIVEVSGVISTIDIPNDSTVNVKFIDSTSGSYIIFPFEGASAEEAKKLQVSDSIIPKGACSGVVYSEILGAHFISFKRTALNKK